MYKILAPQTEEEAIRIINDLRIKTSNPGQAWLIDTSIPIHQLPLRTMDEYFSEIVWRSQILSWTIAEAPYLYFK